MAESNAQVFRCMMDEGFGRGDLVAVDRYFREDFQEHEPVSGPQTGREGVKQIIPVMRGAFLDLRASVEDLSEVGDKFWVRVRFLRYQHR